MGALKVEANYLPWKPNVVVSCKESLHSTISGIVVKQVVLYVMDSFMNFAQCNLLLVQVIDIQFNSKLVQVSLDSAYANYNTSLLNKSCLDFL
jgi:hypothetical protein